MTTPLVTRSGAASSSLANQVVLVTGGARGLGEAIARALAADGARIAIADFRDDLAKATADSICAEHGAASAVAFAADLGDTTSATGIFASVEKQLGPVQILVNNAGTDATLPVEELDIAEWDRIMATNLRAPFILSQQAFQRMAPGGQIVNIVSTAAKRAWPNASAYHASKWGLLGLSHALHTEGRARGIRVTAVIAGGMRTPFLLDRFPDLDPAVLQDPANVAHTVKFVLTMPAESVVPEVTVLPLQETSWP